MEGNCPTEFNELTPEERQSLVSWIATNINAIQSFNDRHTSYGLKHLFESSNDGFYITNGQFKGAMIDLGFNVKDTTDLNWVFNISQKSRCFERK